MFPACPTEMLPTLWLKTSSHDRKCPSQVGCVYDRLVCFQVRSGSVQGLSGDGVLVLKQDRKRRFSKQDGNSVG